jgi:uncharacterized membrane protein
MAEIIEKKTQGTDSLALVVVIIVIMAGVIGALLILINPSFVFALLPGSSSYIIGGSAYEIIYVVLTLVTDVLYLFGGGVIAFGATLVIIKFLQRKLKDPYEPTSSTRSLSGYLTLSLNFFIGAEIVRTVVVGASEIELLLLVIASRGLFSLILYLERRWHGTTESE